MVISKNKITFLKKEIPSYVKIIAVSKKKEEKEILRAYEMGFRNFGENYIQEGIEKINNLKQKMPEAKWHFIGHLQSNKTRFAVENFDFIQTIDSKKIAKKINNLSKTLNKKIDCLIQINIGNEEQKHGIRIENIENVIMLCNELENIKLRGFMCIPPLNDSKKHFIKMQRIFDNYKKTYNLDILSMGMSSDYLEAIKYGSNMVRIGTKIFGKR